MAKTEAPLRPQRSTEPDADSGEAGSLVVRLGRLLPLQTIDPRLRLGLAALSALLLVLGVGWYAIRDEDPLLHERMQESLRLLDEDRPESWEQAREIAEALERTHYRDVDFPGAIEFVLGMAAFREAEGLDERDRDRQYLRAARFLREAEERALEASRRPEWAYALGSSLHALGAATQARPLLEEAVETFAAGRAEASPRLIDIYLDLRTTETLEQALELCREDLGTLELSASQKDRLLLQQAQVLMALDRSADAQDALGRLSQQTAGRQATVVLNAQVLMANEEYAEALELLKPVAEAAGLEQSFPRQAAFLTGRCAEELGDGDAAVRYYERTARRHPDSQEGLAAHVRRADLLRAAGRHEEALEAYREALGAAREPEDFRNRWLSLDEFRERILDAWNAWADSGLYQEAISLSEQMTPLLPADQAIELAARGHQLWAEHLESELQQTPAREHGALEDMLQERQRLSGRAFAELAHARRTSSRYADALWTSAEYYHKGGDFENALEQLTRFLNTRPRQLLPPALVRRGELLMNLDRLDEALEHFQRVIDHHPTDPSAFEAAYLIGQCRLERNEPELAEKAWRDILTSGDLTPAAQEWRLALFSLGRLLYHTAVLPKNHGGDLQDAEDAQVADRAFARLDEAARRLDEFLRRYPDAPQSAEARYLLAKALKQSADSPRQKLKSAETDNARREFRRAMHALLEQAKEEFQQLRHQLREPAEADRLNELERRLLRDSDFEIAHLEYALENYEEAVAAYGSASHRHPHDPRVLLAYVQMMDCYRRLGKPVEARSMLEQARLALDPLPEDTFQSGSTNMSRQEWDQWLERTTRLYQPDMTGETDAP